MNTIRVLVTIFFIGILFVSACQSEKDSDSDTLAFQKELGRHLFFEKRLSITATKSCASCHDPALAFSDGYRKAPGVYADLHSRNTPSLVNVSYQQFFNWANPEITSLELQMDLPLFGKHPIEMGLDSNQATILKELEREKRYAVLLRKAFPKQADTLTWLQVKRSLAQFVSTINSLNAPYDRYLSGDQQAISESAKAGEKLFFSTKLQCSQCHRPPMFGADSSMPMNDQYVNIGLYNYALQKEMDSGLYQSTKNEGDRGKFRIPSLRNLSMTTPYFHDGSGATLDEVLQVYISGGREVNYGQYQGDGRIDPNKHHLITGFTLSNQEKHQLLDFLDTLNDIQISTNTDFKSPF